MKLEFQNISASYGRRKVLEEVTFQVESGSITALVGRNGAGKSTAIDCLMGMKNDYTGRIVLSGVDVREMNRSRRACSVACLPQNLPRPHVTVRELVSFGRAPYMPLSGRMSEDDRNKVRWAVEAVGLANRYEDFVDNLSGGQRKKAFFAMVLAQDTPLVVLDEPTAHLDAVSRFGFLKLLETMRRETGKTFLVVMHELTDVLCCADRIVTLQEGRVVFFGTPEQCLADRIPETCLGIRVSGDRQHGFAALPVQDD